MDDLVDRLMVLTHPTWWQIRPSRKACPGHPCAYEAAVEITALRARIAVLREALKEIAGAGHPDFLSHSQQIARACLEAAIGGV